MLFPISTNTSRLAWPAEMRIAAGGPSSLTRLKVLMG